MFTTEIIHFLQQIDGTVFHAFMVLVSAMGITPWIITVVIGITFAIDFKKGLVLINLVAWTAFITIFAKEQVNYPRPSQIDSQLKFSQYEKIDQDYSHLLPTSFFEVLSEELIEKVAPSNIDLMGFPSGHTSAQVALWMGLAFLFKKRWIKITGIIVVLLTGLSRMYLGSHFLGDIIGGLLIGLAISLILISLIQRTKYMKKQTHDTKSLLFLWLPFFLIALAPYTPHWLSGSVIGINLAALLVILKRNFPIFHSVTWKRIAAAAITLTFFFIAFYYCYNVKFSNNDYIDIILIALLTFGIIKGSIFINRKLHFINFKV